MPPERVLEEPTDQSIFLWPGDLPASSVDDGFKPWLEPYPVETDRPRGAVLVCPGGGYGHRAPHEGTPSGQHGCTTHATQPQPLSS